MTFTPEQINLLEAKLSPANIKPAQKFGPKGDYIEGWLAIAEANRIFGFDGWSYDVLDLRVVAEGERKIGRDQKPGFGVSYVSRVRVNAGGVIREDIGAGHGYDVDLGLAHESAAKEAVTDALKRSLRTFGNVFGLALYDKTRENVGDDTPPPAKPTPAPPRQDNAPKPKTTANDIKLYVDAFRLVLSRCEYESEVRSAWKEHASKREQLGIDSTNETYELLAGLCRDRIEEIGMSAKKLDGALVP